jgi:very-short-patch-repair endonuclease
VIKRKFTDEEERKICEEYFSEEKPSTITLGERWGCDNNTIENAIKRNGFKLRTHKEIAKETKKFTVEQELQIFSEYFSKEKPGTPALAKKWKCDGRTICNIIERNGGMLRNQSDARKGRFKGKNNFNYGKCASEDTRKKQSEAKIGKYIGENNPFYNQHHSEETKQLLREKTILQMQNCKGPFKDTVPELKMKEILTFLNIPFEHQFRLGNCSFDFHVSNTNILIEVDGDYFHANPKKYSTLNSMQLKMRERDKRHDDAAKFNNYILLRFWEDDILNNIDIVKNEIRKIVYEKKCNN